MITTTFTDSLDAAVHATGRCVHTERARLRMRTDRLPRRWLGLLWSVCLLAWPHPAFGDSVVVQDHFNGTGSLASHQPDTNVPNSSWTATGSGASLWNHRAWAAGADWSGILATIDSGVADGTVATDWTPSGDSPYGSVVARASDAANYLIAYYWGGTLYLYRIASTGNVLLASTAVDAPGTATHRVKMVFAGTSIQVWYDGALRLSATDSFNVSVTRHGFRWLSYYDWQSVYSNFEVDGVFVPTAATTSVSPAAPTVPLFRTVTLTATAYDAGHNVIPNMSFSWSTSNAGAVSVTALGASTATVAGVGAGGATITATPLNGSGSTASVTVNTGPVAIYDSFAGADSTALGSHAPEVNAPSGTWTVDGSGAFISGNRATAGGADWSPITASFDTGLADGIVEVDWTAGGLDTPAATIVARITNSTNHLLAHYWDESLWLYRVDSDHYTLLGHAAVADPGTATHHLALKLAGAALEVWWDGVQEIVASDAFNSTATRHGFRWYSWWDWLSTYDRFEVSALPAIASVTITPSAATIPMNGGRMLAAQAYDAAGDPVPGVSFSWRSSDTSVVSTRAASATMGAVIAEGVGSATVTATAFGGGAQQTAAMTVTAAPPPPPTPPPGCAGGVFPASVTWPADGGIGQLTLSAPSNCEWAVEWNAPWITPLQTSGTGNANLSYAIDRNESGVARSGSLTVGGSTFAINQTITFTSNPPNGSGGSGGGGGGTGSSPAVCEAFALSTQTIMMNSAGGDEPIDVSTDSACQWTAQSHSDWISVPQTGTGSSTVLATISPNGSLPSRIGVFSIREQLVVVIQAGASATEVDFDNLVGDPITQAAAANVTDAMSVAVEAVQEQPVAQGGSSQYWMTFDAGANLPSCRDLRTKGNIGYIDIQTSPQGFVQWGAYMYLPWENYFFWHTEEYGNGQLLPNGTKNQFYPPHGSRSPNTLPSGSIFTLRVFHIYLTIILTLDGFQPFPAWAIGTQSCIVP